MNSAASSSYLVDLSWREFCLPESSILYAFAFFLLDSSLMDVLVGTWMLVCVLVFSLLLECTFLGMSLVSWGSFASSSNVGLLSSGSSLVILMLGLQACSYLGN